MSSDEYSKQFYIKNAEKYTAHVRDPKDSLYHAYYEKPAMYALLPDLNGKTVLSLGCGSGEDSIYLMRQGTEKSVGVDITKELIDIAKRSYPECEFQVMDMEHLDFPAESFDFVYSSLAIHYVENWGNVLKEVYKVLKPNSYFLFSCGHPLRFAMDDVKDEKNHVLRIDISKDKITRYVTFTGDYLAKRKILNALGKDTANVWTMSFGEISRQIKEAGFLIDQIVDPKPLEELKEIDEYTYKRLSKIPEFVIFKLIKQ